MKILSDSFTFGTINSLETWGIKVIAYDVFGAPKRERSQFIPFKHGRYNYDGRRWYDEKVIHLDCCTETKELTKSDMREVIGHMSKRNKLVLWDEPDKYYIGELYDSPDIHIEPKRVKQQFTLPLLCEPFAYGGLMEQGIRDGANKIDYKGTAETPCVIILKNTGNETVNNVQIVLTQRRMN